MHIVFSWQLPKMFEFRLGMVVRIRTFFLATVQQQFDILAAINEVTTIKTVRYCQIPSDICQIIDDIMTVSKR